MDEQAQVIFSGEVNFGWYPAACLLWLHSMIIVVEDTQPIADMILCTQGTGIGV